MKNTLLLIEVACGVNDATRAPARAFKLDQQCMINFRRRYSICKYEYWSAATRAPAGRAARQHTQPPANGFT